MEKINDLLVHQKIVDLIKDLKLGFELNLLLFMNFK